MKFVLYTNSISAHQLPLAREIVKRVGADNFRYVYSPSGGRQGGNQEVAASDSWITQDETLCEECDVLLVGGLRPILLMERRSVKGLKTFYQSERWFKPIPIPVLTTGIFRRFLLPGWIRLLHPGYFRMVRRFVRLVGSTPNLCVLPIGPHAKHDFRLLGVPDSKMMDWGYFVAPSSQPSTFNLQPSTLKRTLRVLWVGRPLWWKRVETIRKAVAHVPNAILDVFTNIPITRVREEMRNHDVYVLASNAMEGWGAALSEALEERMACFGTYEAGASAALLPESQLFHAGDWKALASKLSVAQSSSCYGQSIPRDYTAAGAANRLLAWIGEGGL